MTTPTTPAAAAARELARELVDTKLSDVRDMNVIEARDFIVDRITAALLSARQAAQAEQMENDCRAVCVHCEHARDLKWATGSSELDKYNRWIHKLMGAEVVCHAAPIRAQAAATKESETL